MGRLASRILVAVVTRGEGEEGEEQEGDESNLLGSWLGSGMAGVARRRYSRDGGSG